MIFRNAVKRVLTAPKGADHRSADRLAILYDHLGIPAKGLASIQIVGESGKSACATMLSHALSARGYRTGTLSTPFSHTMTECITLDGTPISMDDFTDCVNYVVTTAETIRTTLATLPSLSDEERDELPAAQKRLYTYKNADEAFSLYADELLLTAALHYFSKNGCQLAIIETPTGDRMNAYHLPSPILVTAVTTTHDPVITDQVCKCLGKKTREIVSAIQEREIAQKISDRSAKINCRLTVPLKNQFYTADLAANRARVFYKNAQYLLRSGAYYQGYNLLTVVEILSALKRQGLAVDPASVDLQATSGNTGLPLQFHFMSLAPNIITDFADTDMRRTAFAESLSFHKDCIKGSVILVAEQTEEADELLCRPLEEKGISVSTVVRTDLSAPLRAMKPVIKALSPDETLLILGSRPFVYEIHRAICANLP